MRSNYERAIFDALTEEYEAMIPQIVEEHIFSARFEKKMDRLIKRRQKPYYALISTGARRAACIIAAVVVLSASALSVKAVREKVWHFITRVFSDHTKITTDREQFADYPETIEEEYFIGNLPEDFELVEYVSADTMVYSVYENYDSYISFSQSTKDSYVLNIDNEQSEQSTLETDGQEYMIIHNDNYYTIIWDNGKYVFTLTSNIDKDSTLDLCTSTKIK